MYSFNLDDQMLTRSDDKQFAENSVNAPTLIFNFGDSWREGISIARFTTKDRQHHYDVIIDKTLEEYGTASCPAEVMTSDSFYLSCKNTLEDTTLTTNTLSIHVYSNSFSEDGLTPAQSQSLEEQMLAKLMKINSLSKASKMILNVLEQAVYKDDSDEALRASAEQFIMDLPVDGEIPEELAERLEQLQNGINTNASAISSNTQRIAANEGRTSVFLSIESDGVYINYPNEEDV